MRILPCRCYGLIGIMVLLCGCGASYKVIDFERTNPVRIEKSIQGLDATAWIGDRARPNAAIALLSIEENRIIYQSEVRGNWVMDSLRPGRIHPTETSQVRAGLLNTASLDWGVRQMVEDNLISSLVSGGFRIVERDPEMVAHLLSESSRTYSLLDFENLPSRRQGRSLVEGNLVDVLVTESGSSTPAQRDVTVRDIQIPTDINSADLILAYRVLECGVVYRAIPEERINVERLARTRLHCRLEDAKTGEILHAGLLEYETSDIVAEKDLKNLQTMHYNYFGFRMPNLDVEQGVGSRSAQAGEPVILGITQETENLRSGREARIVGGVIAAIGAVALLVGLL
ncbi:MAG: hypothetical protein FJY73_06105 [Candidatus Eisenbacteria bacterium]|nr:hypothetical protein [Candidatus Eisenbacteria bacterium]